MSSLYRSGDCLSPKVRGPGVKRYAWMTAETGALILEGFALLAFLLLEPVASRVPTHWKRQPALYWLSEPEEHKWILCHTIKEGKCFGAVNRLPSAPLFQAESYWTYLYFLLFFFLLQSVGENSPDLEKLLDLTSVFVAPPCGPSSSKQFSFCFSCSLKAPAPRQVSVLLPALHSPGPSSHFDLPWLKTPCFFTGTKTI